MDKKRISLLRGISLKFGKGNRSKAVMKALRWRDGSEQGLTEIEKDHQSYEFDSHKCTMYGTYLRYVRRSSTVLFNSRPITKASEK